MNSIIEWLKWDSSFFGFKTGRIIITSSYQIDAQLIQSEMQLNGFQLVYCFIDPQNTKANNVVKKMGGNLVDEKVTFYKEIETNSFFVNNNISVYKDLTLTTELYQLSLQSGVHSRFKIDNKFPNGTFEAFYKTWIENSILDQQADICFVYKTLEKITGFITLKTDATSGHIGLIAVDQKLRGLNIGTQMIKACECELASKNINQLRVVTQKANINAMQFYNKNNFKVENIVNVYHLWKD